MNFTVTGGAGFIGSHLARRLVEKGHGVTVVDNLSRGDISNLKDIFDMINFVDLDILEYEKLKEILCNTDGVFHHAALAYIPSSYESEDEYKRCNVTGTENVFQICLECDIKVVYASSSTVYGNVRIHPIPEDSTRKPLNPYGRTKLQAELLAEKYTDMGANIISLRYFNVVGLGRKRAYTGVIPRFLDRLQEGKPPVIYGDGQQIKDFVFVDDVIVANIAAMTSGIKNGFFNIGSGKPISITDLARLMIKMSGRSLEPKYQKPRQGDAKVTVADISKAAKLLNWRPSISLEDGLRNLFPKFLK